MKTYRVHAKEIHIQGYLVKAENPEQAIQIVCNCGGEIDEGDFVYSHMLEPETWTVEEEKL